MIIDIRSNSKYKIGHINGAINIPYKELYLNYRRYLNKSTRYYIYCDYGNLSLDLVNYLNNLGYNCVNLDGGYNKNSHLEINI